MNPTPATTTGTTASTQPGADTVTLNATNPFTGAVAVEEAPLTSPERSPPPLGPTAP